MKWEELLLLLQSYKDEGADLSGIVRFESADTQEPLDLVESAKDGSLFFVVRWDRDGTTDG